MAGENTSSTINAWIKEIYADNLQNLIPEGVRLVKAVKFLQGDKELGDSYIQPVALTHESGFSVGSGAFSLNEAIAATYAQAQVEGKNLLLRSKVSYDAMSRASNSKKAFMKWSEQIIGNMTSSFTKRLEILHFYGGTGIGTVDSIASHVITITDATWASGIWAGAEGVKLESRASATQHDSALVVSSVDLVAKTITVTGDTDTVADDVLYFAGFYGNEMTGLDKIVTNTGTLFNIDASSYALWKGNTYSAGTAALTFSKLQAAVSLGVAKGLDEKVTVYCSPATFANLNSDLAALRRSDSSYKSSKGQNGFEAITYYGVNGEIEVVPSIYVKEGEAFCVPLSRLKRIGSTDVTMQMPGQAADQLVLQLASNAGYELRMFYDGTLFGERPAWCTKVTGIVNS